MTVRQLVTARCRHTCDHFPVIPAKTGIHAFEIKPQFSACHPAGLGIVRRATRGTLPAPLMGLGKPGIPARPPAQRPANEAPCTNPQPTALTQHGGVPETTTVPAVGDR